MLCANAVGTSIARNIPNSGYGTHELRIGLIMQFHFVGLDKLPVDHVDGGNPSVHSSAATEPTDAPSVDKANSIERRTSDRQCKANKVAKHDKTIAAGDQHRLEISGGTHASMMSLENTEQIVSIAQLKVRSHCLSCQTLSLSL